MCIPVDSMLWALVECVRRDGRPADAVTLRALLGSGCTASHLREVLTREQQRSPCPALAETLATLEGVTV